MSTQEITRRQERVSQIDATGTLHTLLCYHTELPLVAVWSVRHGFGEAYLDGMLLRRHHPHVHVAVNEWAIFLDAELLHHDDVPDDPYIHATGAFRGVTVHVWAIDRHSEEAAA